MSSSHKNQNNNLSNSRKANHRNTPFEWTKVVTGAARTNQSFTPTFAQTPVSTDVSNVTDQSIMSESRQSVSIRLVRPFLKGVEKHSVLIDVTDVQSPQMLRDALQAFNKDAIENDGYEDYCGRLPLLRKYLNRNFIETVWSQDSPGHKAILETGITLPDNTYVKGFTSFPADSRIVRLKLEKLPLKPLRLLKLDMQERLSCFGKVLDLGVSHSNGCFMGQGYATLDLNPSTEENDAPFEELQRILLWRDDDGDVRQVLLQWEDMPDFCRLCQRTGHCRADCPDYQKYLKCHNCNLNGHIMRNCPRNNAIDTVNAPNKKRAIINKERKTPVPEESKAALSVISLVSDVGTTASKEDESAEMADDVNKEKDDTDMVDVSETRPIDSDVMSSTVIKPTTIKQVNQLRSPRHGPVKSDINKITKLDGNNDVSDSRNKHTHVPHGSTTIRTPKSDQQQSPSPVGSPGGLQ